MKRKIPAFILCAAMIFAGCRPVSEEPALTSPAEQSSEKREEFVSPVYAALSDNEKELYDTILSAVINFDEAAYFGGPVPRSTVRKIYRLVYAQERKYFWLSSLLYAPEEEMSSLRLKYVYGKEEAEEKNTELEMKAADIISGLPENASDAEAAIYFHDVIVQNCGFSQGEDHVNSAYGVLVKGSGQCEGYAAAMSLLCDKVGIPNYMVCGTNARGETHAWNKLMIDGDWYNMDCTWDDPILTRNEPEFVRHDYCLVTDAEINGITHFPDGLYADVPPCTATEKNYFAVKGLLFDSASEAADSMLEQITAAGTSGEREAELRIADDDVYFAVMARFFDSGEIKRMIENVNRDHGTSIRSAYKHNNDEMNIVHISLIYESDQ